MKFFLAVVSVCVVIAVNAVTLKKDLSTAAVNTVTLKTDTVLQSKPQALGISQGTWDGGFADDQYTGIPMDALWDRCFICQDNICSFKDCLDLGIKLDGNYWLLPGWAKDQSLYGGREYPTNFEVWRNDLPSGFGYYSDPPHNYYRRIDPIFGTVQAVVNAYFGTESSPGLSCHDVVTSCLNRMSANPDSAESRATNDCKRDENVCYDYEEDLQYGHPERGSWTLTYCGAERLRGCWDVKNVCPERSGVCTPLEASDEIALLGNHAVSIGLGILSDVYHWEKIGR